MSTNSQLITSEEVQRQYNISATLLYRLRQSGKIRCKKIGRTVRFAPQEVMEDMSQLAESSSDRVKSSRIWEIPVDLLSKIKHRAEALCLPIDVVISRAVVVFLANTHE